MAGTNLDKQLLDFLDGVKNSRNKTVSHFPNNLREDVRRAFSQHRDEVKSRKTWLSQLEPILQVFDLQAARVIDLRSVPSFPRPTIPAQVPHPGVDAEQLHALGKLRDFEEAFQRENDSAERNFRALEAIVSIRNRESVGKRLETCQNFERVSLSSDSTKWRSETLNQKLHAILEFARESRATNSSDILMAIPEVVEKITGITFSELKRFAGSSDSRHQATEHHRDIFGGLSFAPFIGIPAALYSNYLEHRISNLHAQDFEMPQQNERWMPDLGIVVALTAQSFSRALKVTRAKVTSAGASSGLMLPNVSKTGMSPAKLLDELLSTQSALRLPEEEFAYLYVTFIRVQERLKKEERDLMGQLLGRLEIRNSTQVWLTEAGAKRLSAELDLKAVARTVLGDEWRKSLAIEKLPGSDVFPIDRLTLQIGILKDFDSGMAALSQAEWNSFLDEALQTLLNTGRPSALVTHAIELDKLFRVRIPSKPSPVLERQFAVLIDRGTGHVLDSQVEKAVKLVEALTVQKDELQLVRALNALEPTILARVEKRGSSDRVLQSWFAPFIGTSQEASFVQNLRRRISTQGKRESSKLNVDQVNRVLGSLKSHY